MQKTTLEFPHNARTTYTAVKNLFRKHTKFSSVKTNDELFIVEARHGAWIYPFRRISKDEGGGYKFHDLQGCCGVIFAFMAQPFEFRCQQE